ncbi:hypothetical protein BGX23_005336 [Mortierella sp. AD031]|nr:hypothetical protein BGX23_005336 [Mortierella sp. AD031]KAG0214461.1 hypothetical protein BGX33_002096 [Mortierella sp. NVP41]
MLKQVFARTTILTRALSAQTITRTPYCQTTSLPFKASQTSFTPSSYRRQYTSSSSFSPSSSIQDLVLNTTAQLLQTPTTADEPAPTQETLDALKARITPTSNLKNDLGIDIFKTYQLLDKIEQDLGGAVDIPVEQADKVHTIQDIIDLVSNAQK